MPVIPREIYDFIENKLLRWNDLSREAIIDFREAQERARGTAGADPTAMSAITLEEAKRRMDEAFAWEKVFRRAGRMLDKSARSVMLYMYKEGHTQIDTAEHYLIDRQTVRRHRDTIIAHAALLAAQEGLISLKEEENDGDQADRQD